MLVNGKWTLYYFGTYNRGENSHQYLNSGKEWNYCLNHVKNIINHSREMLINHDYNHYLNCIKRKGFRPVIVLHQEGWLKAKEINYKYISDCFST